MKNNSSALVNSIRRLIFVLACSYLPIYVFAQVSTTLDTANMAYNQISTSLKVYAFPAKNQSNEKQKKDEYACYKWSIQQSGIDPMNMPEVKAAPTDSTGADGKVVGNAAKGALVGLAIGSVAGEAGTGAAVGAIAGGAGGIRQKRVTQARKEEQAKVNVEQQKKAMADSFIKAFTACMEGKGYTLK